MNNYDIDGKWLSGEKLGLNEFAVSGNRIGVQGSEGNQRILAKSGKTWGYGSFAQTLEPKTH
jgi:hypothetical protein